LAGHQNPSSLDRYDDTMEISRKAAMHSMVPATNRSLDEGPQNLVNYTTLKN
jgi:hypothetical protein